MNRYSYKLLALSFVLALLLGSLGAMAPTAAQASDLAGPPHPTHPTHPKMHGYHRHFTQEQMTNPFVRDVFDGKCQWWQYELKHGRYVRTYSPCKYGDAEISYRVNGHLLWSQPGINNGNGNAD